MSCRTSIEEVNVHCSSPRNCKGPACGKGSRYIGNVEKSNTAVMVTGVGVADAEGTEPIVKKAIILSAIAAETILLCRIINILFLMVN